MSNKSLIVILGPTAAGKTSLAVELAARLDTEILSADSRQFFREMNIGTAKPTEEELARTKHHLINSLSVTDEYNVGRFEKDALDLLGNIFAEKDTAIVAGGSGLYIHALCLGFDEVPESDKAIRENLTALYKGEGIEALRAMLKKLDPEHYKKVDLSNPHRLLRAIEVCMVTGKKYSDLRERDKGRGTKDEGRGTKGEGRGREFRVIKIGLNLKREELYERINKRVDDMIEQGLVEEAKSLVKYKHLNALNTVGYKEMFDYLEGKTSLDAAIEKIKQNTRNFAKRQLTWFRRDPEIKWFEPAQTGQIWSFIQAALNPSRHER